MFNILSHRGNANQNCTEIPSHSSQNGHHQENKLQSGGVAHIIEPLPSKCKALSSNTNTAKKQQKNE
jgi:hypothetical protein